MKYIVLIMDGAAGWPVSGQGGKTSLELAHTPNLDILARSGSVGLTVTVPAGMESSSAIACMSLLGYDPQLYYKGRAAIEAISLEIPVGQDEVVFRANLVTIDDGRMRSYAAGQITTEESRQLVKALNQAFAGEHLRLFPGMGYRHILKLSNSSETLLAECTPPHDITDKPIADYLPRGEGSDLLRRLMEGSVKILKGHPVNLSRSLRGLPAATMLWVFWGSPPAPDMPLFESKFGKKAVLSSGVDLLRGLGMMLGMEILHIQGVTDNIDNNYQAQVEGALKSLDTSDLAVIHVEAPDECGHAGLLEEKIKAIEAIDRDMVGRILDYATTNLRFLVMPDHPTPVQIKTHTAEPVPFLLWGAGLDGHAASRFTEREAKNSGLLIPAACSIMEKLIEGKIG